jgi:HAD superfamily hydrolase (TIGR01509 family)
MIKKFKGVIFDLDGTIIDSLGMWEEVDRVYLEKFDHVLPDDLQSAIEGMSFHETALYFKERFSLMDEVEVIKKDWHDLAWQFYENEVTTKESVVDLLKAIKALGIPMAIATSNSRELATLALKRNDLEGCFETIVTSGDVARGKPAPDVFLEAARQIKVDPGHCLVFEDTYAGVLGAKAAGMTVYAVYEKYSEDFLEQILENSDGYIRHYKELL